MQTIALGPLAMPVAPLVLLAALGLGQALVTWLAPRDERKVARDVLLYALMIGLVAARVAHLVLHRDAYADDPLSVIDIRDGGWHVPTGLLAAAAWVVWRGRRVAWRVTLGMASTVSLAAWWGASAWLAGAPMNPVPTQSFASAFNAQPTTLQALGGGRPMVINLWATWCAPCRAEMPDFALAQLDMPDVVFVFVNQGESADTAMRFVRSLPRPLTHVLIDPDWSLSKAVGSKALPTTIFVDAKGRIVSLHAGALNRASLRVKASTLRSQAAASAGR